MRRGDRTLESVLKNEHRSDGQAFHEGFRDGIPIGLGYFAVAFALGVAARSAGLNPLQGFIASITCLASAGQYAGFTVIAARASYFEIAVITLVANARYLLMSTALSQKIDPKRSFLHRFGIAWFVTDEINGNCNRDPGGQPDACTDRQCTECCAVWNVPCSDHPSGKRGPHYSGTGRSQFRGELCCFKAPVDRGDVFRNAYHPAYGHTGGGRGSAVPASF